MKLVKVADASEKDRQILAETYSVKPEDLMYFCLKHINVAKISMPRVPIEGSRNKRDIHGGLQ